MTESSCEYPKGLDNPLDSATMVLEAIDKPGVRRTSTEPCSPDLFKDICSPNHLVQYLMRTHIKVFPRTVNPDESPSDQQSFVDATNRQLILTWQETNEKLGLNDQSTSQVDKFKYINHLITALLIVNIEQIFRIICQFESTNQSNNTLSLFEDDLYAWGIEVAYDYIEKYLHSKNIIRYRLTSRLNMFLPEELLESLKTKSTNVLDLKCNRLYTEGHEERIIDKVALRELLDTLPPSLRKIFRLLIQGYNKEEIALLLATTPGIVQQTRSKAMSILRYRALKDPKRSQTQ